MSTRLSNNNYHSINNPQNFQGTRVSTQRGERFKDTVNAIVGFTGAAFVMIATALLIKYPPDTSCSDTSSDEVSSMDSSSAEVCFSMSHQAISGAALLVIGGIGVTIGACRAWGHSCRHPDTSDSELFVMGA